MGNTATALPIESQGGRTEPPPDTMRTNPANRGNTPSSKTAGRRYYHTDAKILALNTRLFILAVGSIVTALAAMALALYLSLRPPTVIRVNAQGEPDVISPGGQSAGMRVAATPTERAADEIERKGYVNQFLQLFEVLDPRTAEANLAQALNMMPENLRGAMRNQLTSKQVVAAIKSKNMRITIDIRKIEPAAPSEQYRFTVIANKTLRYFEGIKERQTFMTMKYDVALAPVERTESNPFGLTIASFKQEVLSEKTQNVE